MSDREQVTQLINAAAALTSHIRPEMGGSAMAAKSLVLAEITRTKEQFDLTVECGKSPHVCAP